MGDLSAFPVRRDYPRLWSILAGRLMVVTDLHGDWEAYRRARDHFLALLRQGEADALVFTGDLIHSEPEEGPDRSLDIVLDVIRLREQYGDRVIALLGNHEMPHIYSTTLARGSTIYTPDFETALSAGSARDQVKDFLSDLPFYVRTTAGVTMTHAGASSVLANPQTARALFQWNHHQLLQQAELLLVDKDRDKLRDSFAHMNGMRSYAALVAEHFGLSDPNNPIFDDPLRGFLVTLTPAYRILWAALFTRCEKEYGQRYPEILDASLAQLSQDFPPQRVLVTGHMAVLGGVETISGGRGGGSQFRLASAAHAYPRKAGRCLVFDASMPVQNAKELLPQVKNLF